MLAAIAADTAEPGHLVVVPDDDHAIVEFLHPHPVVVLPGIGPATARTLARYGLHTVGDLARTPLPTLQRIIGASAGLQAHHRSKRARVRAITMTIELGDPAAAAHQLYPTDERQRRVDASAPPPSGQRC